MPPLQGRGPAQPPPERRPSSMQDFAADMFSDMITPGMMMSSYYAPPPPPSLPELAHLRSPRASRSPRQRRRDDGSGFRGKRPVSRTRGHPIDEPSAASAGVGPSTSFLQPPPHPTAYTNTYTPYASGPLHYPAWGGVFLSDVPAGRAAAGVAYERWGKFLL
ncbi:hypothetical protein LTR12_012741 [Friedmanniomyces endolithicus]|nr:hypothetical protein LTR12_012741 [Friedmanniomyces endolithicus]